MKGVVTVMVVVSLAHSENSRQSRKYAVVCCFGGKGGREDGCIDNQKCSTEKRSISLCISTRCDRLKDILLRCLQLSS